MRPSVLVTGARAPVALDLARAFAATHDVWLGDSVPARAARWSRVGRGRVLRLPRARQEPNRYADALHRWADEHPGGLIVPTCEEVFHVADAAARHGFADQVYAPDPTVLRRLHSKADFPQWAATLGIDVPHTRVVADPAHLQALAADPRDLVVKPEFSRFGTATLVRPSARALARVRPTPHRRWVVQEYLAGEEVFVWAAARDGQVVASAAYRGSWRLGRSAAFAFEAVDCPQCDQVVAAVVAAARVTGQVSLDLIRTPDGRTVPIECNPRSVSGLHLLADHPGLAPALVGAGPPVRATRGHVMLGPAMVLMGLPEAVRHRRSRQWRRDLAHATDALSRGNELGPVVGALVDLAGFATVGAFHRRSATQQTTADIEWNGDDR